MQASSTMQQQPTTSLFTTIVRKVTATASVGAVLLMIFFGGDCIRLAFNCIYLWPLSSTIGHYETVKVRDILWKLLQVRAHGFIYTYFLFDQVGSMADHYEKSVPFRLLQWFTAISYPVILLLGYKCRMWDQYLMLLVLKVFIITFRTLYSLYQRSTRIRQWFGLGRKVFFGRTQASDLKKNQ